MATPKASRKPVTPDTYIPIAEGTAEELVTKCQNIYKTYHDSTFKYRRQWYLNDNFYDGKHFVWWRRSTGTIDRIQPPKGAVLRSIPKASRQIDAIQNLMTANRPKWVVYPEKTSEGELTPEAEGIAKRSGHWLDKKFDDLNMDERIDDLVHYALKFPFSFFEVGYDGKEIGVTVWDAFDILFYPSAPTIYDSPVLIKCIEKDIEEVRNNSVYDQEEAKKIKPTSKTSGDELKDMRQMEKFGHLRGRQGENTCNIKEFLIKEWTEDGVKIRIVTLANDDILLRNETTDMTEFPYVCYAPKSGSLHQPAWIERLISPNKSLDLIVSNIENFFHLMTKGYWIKHRNANVSRIVNEHGAFIEWDVMEPKQAELASIPNYVFAHLANLEKWIEEQSTSSVTVGRIPKGIKAYKAIESLKQSDWAGLKVPITRLETALEKTAELMLDLADKYYDKPKVVYRMEAEKPDYFNVIGNKYFKEGMDAIPIKGEYKVNVSVESGLAYTEEGKRQTMLELYSAGLMPAEKVLDVFRFSNIGELLRQVQAERQVSMIDTQDFEALSDETKQLVLQELIGKNVSLPSTPQPEMMQFRRRERKKGGEQ